MPTGYNMVNVLNVITRQVREMYPGEAAEYLEHPWFSQFYVVDGTEPPQNTAYLTMDRDSLSPWTMHPEHEGYVIQS